MDRETLNEILQGQVQPDPSFLDEAKPTSEDVKEANPLACPHCDYVAETEMGLRAHQKKHKKDGVVEVESAKPKKEKYETNISEIPSDYDRLASLLQSFGVPNHKGVIEGMKLYNINDINTLKDLLRNVSTPQGKSDAIVKVWAEMQGLNRVPQVSELTAKKTDGLDEVFAMQERMLRMKMLESMVGQNNGSKANPEFDSLKSIVLQLQESNRALQQQLTQQATENRIKQLEEELKESRKEAQNDIGSLASSLKDFTQNLTNAFEKHILERDFHRREDELKKEVEIAKANSNKSFIEKGLEVVDKKLDAAGQVFGMAAKQNMDIEKAQTARDLINQGVPKNEAFAVTGLANNIIHNNMRELDEIEAHKELKKLADELNKQPVSPQPQPQPQTQPEPIVEPQPETIRFATGPDER